jgi:UDP-N-acetylglucosamine:LPS N-acetylglucosamine transferase
VITRAGSGTIFELEFFAKKSLLIPLESSSTAHQVDNAHASAIKRPDLFSVVHQQEALVKPVLFAQKITEGLEL